MKKKPSFLLPLLMAIVMMAMSPTKVWADECTNCSGSGYEPCTQCNEEGQATCFQCNGQGGHEEYGDGEESQWVQCGNCNGEGYITCRQCNGTKNFGGTCNTCNGTGLQGNGTAESPYKIATAKELIRFAEMMNNNDLSYTNAVLTDDIVVNDGEFDADGNFTATGASETSTPISVAPMGTSVQNAYKGTFDGDGHTISGLYFAGGADDDYVGLIGYISPDDNGGGGTVKRLGLTNVYYSGCANGCKLGAVTGHNNGKIENCYATGVLKNTGTGSPYTGGICGYNNGPIKNCYTTITSSVYGYNSSVDDVTNCYVLTTDGNTQAANFASGEICYLLNGSRSEGTAESPLVWYQNLSAAGGDTAPVLKAASDGSNTVYYVDVKKCDGTVTGQTYSNTNAAVVGSHNYDNDVCTNCGKYRPVALASGGATTYYDTFAAALAAATDGATITLNEDVTVTAENNGSAIVIPEDIYITAGLTIDLGKKKLTINADGNGKSAFSCDGGKIIIKNGTIDIDNFVYGLKTLFTSLTLDGVTVDGLHNYVQDQSFAGISVSGYVICAGLTDVVLNNSTIIAPSVQDHKFSYYNTPIIGNNTLTLTGTSTMNDCYINLYNCTMKAAATATINECTLYVHGDKVGDSGDLYIVKGSFGAPYDYKWTAGEDGLYTLSQHTLTKTEADDATCTKAGNSAYWTCSVCNKYFSDAEGKTEIEEDSWVILATGHAYVEDATNQKVTCSHTGCSLTAPMMTVGVHDGQTYYTINDYTSTADASAYTTLFYFKAPVSGTLTVTDRRGDDSTNDDSYGALFNADMSSCLTSDDNSSDYGNCFKFTYDVTEGQVYWIGAFAIGVDDCNDHTLTISLTSQVALSKVGDRYYTSFGAPYIYNVTNAGDDLKVYVATSLRDGVLTMTQAGNAAIPAGKGVVIVGTSSSSPETMTATIVDAEEAMVEFDLLGATKAGMETTGKAFFSAVNGIVGFYAYNTTLGDVPAGKAYLELPTVEPDGGTPGFMEAKGFTMVFEDETASINNEQLIINNAAGVVYNLQGQRLAAPQKGLNIVNGKKVMVK